MLGFIIACPPKISVVIPIYNREELLHVALDSILEHTFKDFECIIVNDGSTNNTINILEEYQKKDSRIRVIDLKENKEISHARNVGND